VVRRLGRLYSSTELCNSSIALFDTRAATPLRKVVMLKRANMVAWNPCEAFNFTVASEDNNLYSFDMRRLDSATNVHKDFVSVRTCSYIIWKRLPFTRSQCEVQAVVDVDYSPTGREFVAGSYDRSVRIFPYNGGHSREVYFTRRMQRCVGRPHFQPLERLFDGSCQCSFLLSVSHRSGTVEMGCMSTAGARI